MTRTSDGFEIAEVDLKLRGPGDLMGTHQSGVLNLKIANLIKDKAILAQARYYAQKTLKDDPTLIKPINAPLKSTYIKINKNRSIWKHIS